MGKGSAFEASVAAALAPHPQKTIHRDAKLACAMDRRESREAYHQFWEGHVRESEARVTTSGLILAGTMLAVLGGLTVQPEAAELGQAGQVAATALFASLLFGLAAAGMQLVAEREVRDGAFDDVQDFCPIDRRASLTRVLLAWMKARSLFGIRGRDLISSAQYGLVLVGGTAMAWLLIGP